MLPHLYHIALKHPTKTINLDSKKLFESIVGHAITHVFEKTKFYEPLKKTMTEYAKSKGEWDSRLEDAKQRYKGVKDADPEREVVAELVGDYLFTDGDFVDHLMHNNHNLFMRIYNEIKYLCKIATAGSEQEKKLFKVKRAFDRAYNAGGKNGKAKPDGGMKLSISEIVDENHKSYGMGVRLDSTLLEDLSDTERVEMVKEYIKELGGTTFSAIDNNGNPVNIKIAEKGTKFKNQKGKNVPVNKDLSSKYIGNKVKQEAITLINELVETSEFLGTEPARYSHGWVDNNGQNAWEYWTTHIVDKNNTIWKATLNVANSANGEKILYDIGPIEKVGQSVKSDTSLLDPIIAEDGKNVNDKSMTFSLSVDSDGNKLTEAQAEWGKNSKVRDENGNLKVMYHGSQNAGFHVFDANMSDDGISLFFVDRNDVAASYSGTTETYEARTISLRN